MVTAADEGKVRGAHRGAPLELSDAVAQLSNRPLIRRIGVLGLVHAVEAVRQDRLAVKNILLAAIQRVGAAIELRGDFVERDVALVAAVAWGESTAVGSADGGRAAIVARGPRNGNASAAAAHVGEARLDVALQTLILVLGIVELLVELLNVLPELLDELVLVEALLRRRVLSLAAGCLLRLTGTRAGRRVRRELLPQLGVDLLQLGDLGVALGHASVELCGRQRNHGRLRWGSGAASAAAVGSAAVSPPNSVLRPQGGGADDLLAILLKSLNLVLGRIELAAELRDDLILRHATLRGVAAASS